MSVCLPRLDYKLSEDGDFCHSVSYRTHCTSSRASHIVALNKYLCDTSKNKIKKKKMKRSMQAHYRAVSAHRTCLLTPNWSVSPVRAGTGARHTVGRGQRCFPPLTGHFRATPPGCWEHIALKHLHHPGSLCVGPLSSDGIK